MVGIYCIKNLVNGKRYIGKSKDLECRIYGINENIEGYYRNDHLTNSIIKYGIQNFSAEIIEECALEELNSREIYWISHYKTSNPMFGYNKTLGGDGGNFTEEIKNKISNTLRNKYPHGEHYMQGFKHTVETKEKMSQFRKGKSTWTLGKHLSNSTKEKLSQLRRNKIWMTNGVKEVFIRPEFLEEYQQLGYRKGRIIKGNHYHPEGLSEVTKQKLRESATGKKYPNRRYLLYCKACGQEFLGTAPRQRYCKDCQSIVN